MTRPALIVCEPRGLWATALRRAAAGQPLPLVETRRPQDAWQHVAEAPGSLLAVAWSAERRAPMAELVDRVGRRFPRVPVVVLIDRRLASDEWLACELGAIHVCPSPRQLGVVVRLARRHLGERAVAQSWPAMQERIEEIWQTLPWNSQEGLNLA